MWESIKAGTKILFGFGSNNAAGKRNMMEAVKGVGGWIDNLKYTDQEAVASQIEFAGIFNKFLEQTRDENSERSRARRDIALLIIRWELIMLTLSALLFKIDQPWSKYIFKIATLEIIVYLVLGVGGFFFGSHLIRAYQGKKPNE